MSDHFSGPAVMGDPSVDITDFYAFVSPERAGNLVLIMDVFPLATSESFFSDVVTHRFRLRPLTRSGGSLTHGTAEHTVDWVLLVGIEPGELSPLHPLLLDELELPLDVRLDQQLDDAAIDTIVLKQALRQMRAILDTAPDQPMPPHGSRTLQRCLARIDPAQV